MTREEIIDLRDRAMVAKGLKARLPPPLPNMESQERRLEILRKHEAERMHAILEMAAPLFDPDAVLELCELALLELEDD